MAMKQISCGANNNSKQITRLHQHCHNHYGGHNDTSTRTTRRRRRMNLHHDPFFILLLVVGLVFVTTIAATASDDADVVLLERYERNHNHTDSHIIPYLQKRRNRRMLGESTEGAQAIQTIAS